MKDLSCSIPPRSHLYIVKPSPAKFQLRTQHHHLLVTSHKHLHGLRLSSTHNFQSTCWLASSHNRAKTFAVLRVGTDEQQTDESTRLAQDIIHLSDEANNGQHSTFDTYGIASENGKALVTSTNVQLSINTGTQHDEANAIMDLSGASELSTQSEKPGNIHNVHAPNNCMLTHFEITHAQNEEKILKRKSHQMTYLFAALASSVGITSLAGASVYYRFAWQMEGGEVPWTEMFGTFSLALGAAVGMEYWARWAHRALWHASLWSMHESHHRPRDGPFELNDIFAIINAVPAIALMDFGFLHKGLVPGLCFGAGLGITIFGIAYMFVHDGLVHRRFPVGPIADVPYFQKVAAAHQLHHADRFNGVPYGLFLGPMELEEVGGRTELEKLLQKRKREKANPIEG